MDAATHPQLAWLVDWIHQYPILTGVFIFSIAMLESLVLIGISIPGAALIIAFGALVALGYLDFTTTMLLCITGAIAGDGISYWIGYRYQEQLKNIWPFKHFKSQIQSGERFFEKHGGKSVVFGRFVGPVRAIIPTIAGMMGMSPLRFTIINVLSAIAWAPAYLLPGMVFGASLELASEVAVRLVIIIMAIVIVLLIMRWLLKKTLRYIQPRADNISQKSLLWARKHKFMGPLVEALVDPRQPESPALLLFALVLIVSGLGFFIILHNLAVQTSSIDLRLYDLILSFRTPWIDQIMIWITMLGDTFVIAAVTIMMAAWLLYQRNIPAALHWCAAILFGAILTRVLKISLQIPRPDPGMFPDTAHYSFPSAHSTMSMLLYGFLSIIISREIRADKRVHVYVFFGLIISLIAISRLYLGAHWLSDVIGGLTLGLIWITLLGITYRRHPSVSLPVKSLMSISVAAIVISASIHWHFNLQREQQRYLKTASTTIQTLRDWPGREWNKLASYRKDLANTSAYPFNTQWNGSIESIKKILNEHGWTESLTINLPLSMKWLSKNTPLHERPVLPQVHGGKHESLAMTYYNKENKKVWVIRFWPSLFLWKDKTIWLGQIAPIHSRSFLNLFHYPVTKHDFTSPLQLLEKQLTDIKTKMVTRKQVKTNQQHWSGKILLVLPASQN